MSEQQSLRDKTIKGTAWSAIDNVTQMGVSFFVSIVLARLLSPDDYKISVNWRNDDDITSKLGGGKYFVSNEIERQWVQNAINQNKDVRLAICTVDSNLYIGNVYLTGIDYVNRKATSHILIGNHDYWNGGYGTEAMRLLLDYAFNHKNLRRIEAHVLEDNIGSCKVHEKLGYKREGLLRESVYKDGLYKNQICYALLKSEYNPVNL